MSAFLGPIHTWLYNKIKFQDAMTDAILDFAEENGCGKELRARTDSRYGVLLNGNLEDMIDTGNIHGWLQEKVSLVENRLAYVVTELMGPDQERLSHIVNAVLEFGKRNSADKNITVRKGYDYLEPGMETDPGYPWCLLDDDPWGCNTLLYLKRISDKRNV